MCLRRLQFWTSWQLAEKSCWNPNQKLMKTKSTKNQNVMMGLPVH